MQTQLFVNVQYDIEAIRVTEDNLEEVAEWCGGQIHREPTGRFIQVPVRNPLRPRQEKAFVGDWVLKSRTGFKSYTHGAFQKSYSPKSEGSVSSGNFGLQNNVPDNDGLEELLSTTNVFESADNSWGHGTVDPRDAIAGAR